MTLRVSLLRVTHKCISQTISKYAVAVCGVEAIAHKSNLAALGAALTSAAAHITPEVTAQVKKKMGEIFGK
ncbi:MAG: hypothetical protein ACRDEA_12475 [Microcystaceae cyanobacterium]